MHQQLWGYKVEEKIYVGVREWKSLNIILLENSSRPCKATEENNVFSKVDKLPAFYETQWLNTCSQEPATCP
jgi:hypothetical protein